MRRLAQVVLVGTLLLASSPQASAQRGPALAEVTAKLGGPDADVLAALETLAETKPPQAVGPIVTLIREGRRDAVTDRAIETLGAIAHRSAIPGLLELLRHRREGVRIRAYRALAAIDDPRVPALLEQGLRDSSAAVRGAAARALGEVGARGSVDTLLVAFDRGVPEAAAALGKLGDARVVSRFDRYLGARPLSVMLSGYDAFLKRTDLSRDVKKDIVVRLGEVASPEIRQFLLAYLGTLDARRDGALYELVGRTARRIRQRGAPTGAPGARPTGARPTGAPTEDSPTEDSPATDSRATDTPTEHNPAVEPFGSPGDSDAGGAR